MAIAILIVERTSAKKSWPTGHTVRGVSGLQTPDEYARQAVAFWESIPHTLLGYYLLAAEDGKDDWRVVGGFGHCETQSNELVKNLLATKHDSVWPTLTRITREANTSPEPLSQGNEDGTAGPDGTDASLSTDPAYSPVPDSAGSPEGQRDKPLDESQPR